MLDKSKVKEYFDATALIKDKINIVGCGSIGSHLAELFARQGVESVELYDFDVVSAHNITNQMFFAEDIGTPKVDAVEKMMLAINPDIKVIKHEKGLEEPFTLNGFVFLCVDNIELRKKIVEANRFNPNVVAFFDFRTRLTDSQCYAARRADARQMKALLESMNFTHDEVLEETPVSACGVELNVVDVIKVTTSIGFANFRNFVKTGELKVSAIIDMENLLIDVI